ncbi:hypothetical protein MVEN_01313200 [Mycena venus]|uniref:Uncharacterized protein n=1 Tax=Mycena venus TaxID=2733690 RepID=A0A8H7CW19_9AGAR|nr:hypothetical protein MVEN_01313200 [Mycena venus]
MDDDRETPTPLGTSTTLPDLDYVGRTCNAAFINNSAGGISINNCPTNVTFTTAPSPPSDFRVIPLGDIDLQHEICVNYGTGVVDLQRERAYVRRMYSARVEGRKLRVTVAVYQAGGAEQRWQQNITKYKSVRQVSNTSIFTARQFSNFAPRHPNIIQIWGTAKSGEIHATIFHGDLSSERSSAILELTFQLDLMPLRQILDLNRQSAILTAYIYACTFRFHGGRRLFPFRIPPMSLV